MLYFFFLFVFFLYKRGPPKMGCTQCPLSRLPFQPFLYLLLEIFFFVFLYFFVFYLKEENLGKILCRYGFCVRACVYVVYVCECKVN